MASITILICKTGSCSSSLLPHQTNCKPSRLGTFATSIDQSTNTKGPKPIYLAIICKCPFTVKKLKRYYKPRYSKYEWVEVINAEAERKLRGLFLCPQIQKIQRAQLSDSLVTSLSYSLSNNYHAGRKSENKLMMCSPEIEGFSIWNLKGLPSSANSSWWCKTEGNELVSLGTKQKFYSLDSMKLLLAMCQMLHWSWYRTAVGVMDHFRSSQQEINELQLISII